MTLAAAMWAVYTLLFRRSGLTPIQAAALICIWSAALFLPAYLLLGLSRFGFASMGEIAIQIVYQGMMMSGVAIITFNRAVALLGATAASAIIALLPAVATALATLHRFHLRKRDERNISRLMISTIAYSRRPFERRGIMRPLNLRSILRRSALALAVAGVLGGIAAAPASAEEWYRHGGYGHYDHDDGWRAREWRAHESREHRYYRNDGPRVVYGTPSYYAPGYYYAPPAVTFGFNFR